MAATRALAEEAAQRLREQAQAKGIGHFSTERPVRVGEEHLEAPVSRTVVAALALVGLLLLVGVGWWITRSSGAQSSVNSSSPATVAIYVPPTTTVVAYSPLTTVAADPHHVMLGPISVVMPGTITTTPVPGSTLSGAPLVAQSSISAGHFATVSIRSVDSSAPDAINSLLADFAATTKVPLSRRNPTTALGGLPAIDFDLGVNQKHHGLEVMGPGFVLILDVWHTSGSGTVDDAAAFASLSASLVAAPA